MTNVPFIFTCGQGGGMPNQCCPQYCQPPMCMVPIPVLRNCYGKCNRQNQNCQNNKQSNEQNEEEAANRLNQNCQNYKPCNNKQCNNKNEDEAAEAKMRKNDDDCNGKRNLQSKASHRRVSSCFGKKNRGDASDSQNKASRQTSDNKSEAGKSRDGKQQDPNTGNRDGSPSTTTRSNNQSTHTYDTHQPSRPSTHANDYRISLSIKTGEGPSNQTPHNVQQINYANAIYHDKPLTGKQISADPVQAVPGMVRTQNMLSTKDQYVMLLHMMAENDLLRRELKWLKMENMEKVSSFQQTTGAYRHVGTGTRKKALFGIGGRPSEVQYQYSDMEVCSTWYEEEGLEDESPRQSKVQEVKADVEEEPKKRERSTEAAEKRISSTNVKKRSPPDNGNSDEDLESLEEDATHEGSYYLDEDEEENWKESRRYYKKVALRKFGKKRSKEKKRKIEKKKSPEGTMIDA